MEAYDLGNSRPMSSSEDQQDRCSPSSDDVVADDETGAEGVDAIYALQKIN
jgi:hypothetical protein